MRVPFQYVSDLHLEHRSDVPFEKIGVAAPNLILAGDIGKIGSTQYHSLLRWASVHFDNVYVVLGNHEYYGASVADTLERAEAFFAAYPLVHWLHRRVVEHPSGLRIAGATLWSDVTPHAFYAVRDSRAVKLQGPLKHQEYLALHSADRAFFEAALRSDAPVLCVSHHAPLLDCNRDFPGSPIASAFYSDLSPLFRPPLVGWVYGHTHSSMRVERNGIPCMANCLGYPAELGWDPGFRVASVFDVDL